MTRYTPTDWTVLGTAALWILLVTVLIGFLSGLEG